MPGLPDASTRAAHGLRCFGLYRYGCYTSLCCAVLPFRVRATFCLWTLPFVGSFADALHFRARMPDAVYGSFPPYYGCLTVAARVPLRLRTRRVRFLHARLRARSTAHAGLRWRRFTRLPHCLSRDSFATRHFGYRYLPARTFLVLRMIFGSSVTLVSTTFSPCCTVCVWCTAHQTFALDAFVEHTTTTRYTPFARCLLPRACLSALLVCSSWTLFTYLDGPFTLVLRKHCRALYFLRYPHISDWPTALPGLPRIFCPPFGLCGLGAHR